MKVIFHIILTGWFWSNVLVFRGGVSRPETVWMVANEQSAAFLTQGQFTPAARNVALAVGRLTSAAHWLGVS